ncbi:hypothetical protein EAO77_37265 [Streptomyces sp. t39]|nr:hypothetical protein EAO77_37265 [Streptomyces sp. t39]
MQDGASISGDDAAGWLREHFKDDPHPEVRITSGWSDEPAEQASHRRVLEILFAPRPDSPAA